MQPRLHATLFSSITLRATAALLLIASGCSDPRAGAGVAAPRENESAARGLTADKSLAAFQYELLELAFKTASSLPVEPHLKSRSRAQETVVLACLELEQPRRAESYIGKIDNWRRGLAYANLAFYWAQHGDAGQAQRCLDLAAAIAESPEGESPQEWRRDRIRVQMAKTYLLLGDAGRAAQLEAGVVDSEGGKTDAVSVMQMSEEAFDDKMKALDHVVLSGNLDRVRNAMATLARLFDRFYADQARGAQVEEKLKAAGMRLPVTIRIEALLDLAGCALEHQDSAKAVALLDDARSQMQVSDWTRETELPLRARWAQLRYRAGDAERARREADAALAEFATARHEIVNIERAGVLRPIAEAYQSFRDTRKALELYKQALEEGVENPNSRPRAGDLTATCCSMALHGVEPDEALRERMSQVYDALGEPW
ncbi:MAG: hypothetical protein AB1486_17725 [Planctomycetota bacterium]